MGRLSKWPWNATVRTLIKLITTSDAPVFSYFCCLLFLLHALLFIVLLIKEWKRKFFQDSSTVFFYLFYRKSGCYHNPWKGFKVNYPEDRIALYFFPLFLGCSCSAWQAKALKKIPFTILLLFPYFFCRHNFSWGSPDIFVILYRR